MSKPSQYTFGDNPRAARRLELLAAAFEAPTRELLSEWGGTPERCIDLGCGPGRTTALLHDTLGARCSLGVDRSDSLLEQARLALSLRPEIEFVNHDVQVLPFPFSPAHCVLARFLLTHLSEAAQSLLGWQQLLAPGGRLLVQEVAKITSSNSVVQRYYSLVAELQAYHGQSMHVGQCLGELASSVGLLLLHSRVRRFTRPAKIMAELHAMNLPTWRKDPQALEHFDAKELAYLEVELGRIARGQSPAEPIEIQLGELVVAASGAETMSGEGLAR